MASSVATMAMAGTVVPLRNVSGLSSSSSFGSSVVNAAPLRPAAKRNVMVTRAALPEETSGRTARREMLASLMAAGAALATVGSSMAATGPGGSGAKRTNEKANDLLKSADKLTNEESPPRFGPGRTGGGDDTGKIAQQGGSGAISELQEGGTGAVEAAKANVAKAKARIDGIFGKKTGDISDASGILNDPAGKVKSDLDTAGSKVGSDIETAKKTAGSFGADAQSKIDNSTGESKGVFDNLVDQLKDAVPK